LKDILILKKEKDELIAQEFDRRYKYDKVKKQLEVL